MQFDFNVGQGYEEKMNKNFLPLIQTTSYQQESISKVLKGL